MIASHLSRLTFFILLNSLAPQAFAGWYSGNAGDIHAAEFILTGRDLYHKLQFIENAETNLPIDVKKFEATVEASTVRSEDRVYNDGYEVDAVNFPEKLEIILNRTRWLDLRRGQKTKERYLIVLHEYLWLMGYDDQQFKISNQLIDWLDLKNYNPSVFWRPVNPVNILEISPISPLDECKLPDLRFDPAESKEEVVIESNSNCPEKDHRKVQVTKDSLIIPPSEGVRGVFHRYTILIFNKKGDLIGEWMFEPLWGRCLKLEDSACRSSSTIFVGQLGFNFGFTLTKEKDSIYE